MNHVRYLEWIDDHARCAFGEASVLSLARLEYLADARAGDEVSLSGVMTPAGLVQEVRRAGAELLRAAVVRVPA